MNYKFCGTITMYFFFYLGVGGGGGRKSWQLMIEHTNHEV